MDYAAQFNTPLSTVEMKKFQQWLALQQQRTGRDYSNDMADYDIQGWFKANAGKNTPNGHFTDIFKKPNHPTFSDQSKYSGAIVNGAPLVGGSWDSVGGRDVYTPSADMVREPGRLTSLLGYMQENEPNSMLNMDKRASRSTLAKMLGVVK